MISKLDEIWHRWASRVVGEWKVYVPIGQKDNTIICHLPRLILDDGPSTTFEQKYSSAEFISHAADDIEYLMGEVKRLNRELEEIKNDKTA